LIAKQDFDTPGDALPRPHEHCYWLLPGRVLAGAHPARLLPALLQAGITHFVDLTSEFDVARPYVPDPAQRLSHPIRDFGVPTAQDMRHSLDAIQSVLAEEGTCVYLHCKAGIGRTGTVAACLLVEYGYSADEAMALLQRKWRVAGQRFGSPRTPETEPQRRFIAAWGQ
jgi:hypothetical protein